MLFFKLSPSNSHLLTLTLLLSSFACTHAMQPALANLSLADKPGQPSIQDEELIRKLQKDKAIPPFIIADDVSQLGKGFTPADIRAGLKYELGISDDYDATIHLGCALNKNTLNIVAEQPLPNKVLGIDSLATLYAYVIGLNNVQGNILAQTWATWSAKAPRSFVHWTQHYLMGKQQRNVFEQFAINTIKSAPTFKDSPADVDPSFIDRYLLIFRAILSQSAQDQYDKEFIKTMTRFFVGADACRCQCFKWAWATYSKSKPVKLLKEFTPGKQILSELIDEKSSISDNVKYWIEHTEK